MMGKDGWIDFEKEISKVIQTIDRVNRKIKSEEKVDDISPDDKQLLNFFEMDIRKILKVGIEENKTKFLADLNRLIRSLEIYLAYYVGRMNPEIRLSDIENLDIQRVLSFNYTDTYEKLYDTNESKKVIYDYIHGRICPDSDENTSNATAVLRRSIIVLSLISIVMMPDLQTESIENC